MDIVRILAGIVLLTLGRKLFWLFVGVAGFVLGFVLATQFLSGQPDWIVLVIALVVGLVGVLFALFLQRLAVGVAGFIAGGYILINLLNALGWQTGQLAWLPFVIGGIIGAVLVLILFDWALIILSSLTGATLIVQTLHFGSLIMALAFIVLLVVGIMIQASMMTRQEPSVPAPPAEA
jgi:hypothetical protein